MGWCIRRENISSTWGTAPRGRKVLLPSRQLWTYLLLRFLSSIAKSSAAASDIPARNAVSRFLPPNRGLAQTKHRSMRESLRLIILNSVLLKHLHSHTPNNCVEQSIQQSYNEGFYSIDRKKKDIRIARTFSSHDNLHYSKPSCPLPRAVHR